MKSEPKRKANNKKTTSKNPKGKSSKLKTSRTHKPEDLELDEWQRILRKQYGKSKKIMFPKVTEEQV